MSLFDRLGGEGAISAVVDKFYQFMLSDQRVAHYFETVDMQKQRKRQKQFIMLVTGGPHFYEGQDMKKAHCKHNIGQFQFDCTWQNLFKALDFFKVPEAESLQLKEIFYSVKDDIVNKKQIDHTQAIEESTSSKCPFNQATLKKQVQVLQKQKCQEKTLFDKLGGKNALSLVVQKFYDIMLADPRVSRYFENTNIEKQKSSQIQFLSMVTGGPMNYAGKDMKQAHCPYKIGIYQFDSTWENLQKSLEIFNVPLELIKEIQVIFYSVQQDIVNYQPSMSIPVTLQESQIVNSSPIKISHCKQSKIQPKALNYSDKPSQNQKRKIKLEVMEKQKSINNRGKLNNCPYSKTYY